MASRSFATADSSPRKIDARLLADQKWGKTEGGRGGGAVIFAGSPSSGAGLDAD